MAEQTERNERVDAQKNRDHAAAQTEPAQSKKPYNTPRLKIYGHIGDFKNIPAHDTDADLNGSEKA